MIVQFQLVKIHKCDSHFHKDATKNLMITCLDQIDIDPNDILKQINPKHSFAKVLTSYSDDGTKIEKLK